MEVLQGGGDTPGGSAYVLIGQARTFRVNTSANTFTPIVNVTAQSVAYGVQFTWTVPASTVDNDGLPSVATQKTGEVNQICATAHVQDLRTEQDQGPSQVLYNFAVITVGTDDQSITDEVRVRMDMINEPAAFQAIADSWARLVAAGAPASGVVAG